MTCQCGAIHQLARGGDLSRFSKCAAIVAINISWVHAIYVIEKRDFTSLTNTDVALKQHARGGPGRRARRPTIRRARDTSAFKCNSAIMQIHTHQHVHIRTCITCHLFSSTNENDSNSNYFWVEFVCALMGDHTIGIYMNIFDTIDTIYLSANRRLQFLAIVTQTHAQLRVQVLLEVKVEANSIDRSSTLTLHYLMSCCISEAHISQVGTQI